MSPTNLGTSAQLPIRANNPLDCLGGRAGAIYFPHKKKYVM